MPLQNLGKQSQHGTPGEIETRQPQATDIASGPTTCEILFGLMNVDFAKFFKIQNTDKSRYNTRDQKYRLTAIIC